MKIQKEGGFRLEGKSPFPVPGKPTISIITIVYNGAVSLEKTILSVLNQAYPNLEYILIDGGSTDGTLDIISKYKDKIAYWKSEPDKGISDAFNKGIALATGQIIGIINADDWYEPDTFRRIAMHFQPDTVLHGNMQYWNPDGSKGMYVRPNQTLLLKEMTINHPTVFVAASIYSKYGSFSLDYRLAMDYQLLLRLYLADVPFIHVDHTLSNMTSGGFSSNWINCYQEVQKAKDELLGVSISHRLFYQWQVLRRRTSEALSNTPLSFINKIYRTYFSPMKKA